ncbi:MAG TPA: hypothetical protein VIN06_12055 [Devosia sp.]
MIQVSNKKYQISLWMSEEHRADPALRMEFDDLHDARAEFVRHRQSGTYRSGILYEWRKVSGSWDLVERFPD